MKRIILLSSLAILSLYASDTKDNKNHTNVRIISL
ncbi:hypothetical protein X910_07115 [Campylobacter jejuni subsp. jejuni 81-176-UMCW9]|nr:hypothetical protein X909_08590 [Campylobacter jejuni subsp. jejuni 81-176-UMCW7]ETN90122.1 hypothetical protein X910_07115 [Campylobacter jejuni subsp. jejuni 81-176-UMCW9]